ncbi:MAG: hypothetical protein JNM31_08580 [Flavobacteriales bacterium]|nr:hypothetical protein [Flavobacteriales bacterium]
MRWKAILLSLLSSLQLVAQPDTVNVPHSSNGWYLSPHGTIRVLVLFAEIAYDKEPGRDPANPNAAHWPKGQLPVWKDDLFDPHTLPMPKAMVTRYYHDVSLGHYRVLGDYVDRIITLKESAYPDLRSAHGINRHVITEVNKDGELRTRHKLTPADFDLWQRGGKPGMPKKPDPDTPHSYDHVMVILRNSSLTHGQGSTDPGSSGKLFGFESDSQSRFGGMNALPFEILKHEFNHLLLGGNNFHSGGGNAPQFTAYFICQQGGWSLMGAANSSLLTCSAWDRDRLGWAPEGSVHRINARNASSRPISGDLDPLAGDTGVFVLRDFVTSGDALRIRMPFIATGEHRQWLWLENHQTYARNGSPTDRYHWEDAVSCVTQAVPGIYMQMQVEREERTGPDLYGGHADYLRPVIATGNFDIRFSSDTVSYVCPFGGRTRAYEVRDRWMNPLTGNQEQELFVFDRNGDGRLQRSEHQQQRQVYRNGRLQDDSPFFGHRDHAFTPLGNRKLGMGTNPSSANMLTLLSGGGGAEPDRKGQRNVRTIHLNGISVEVLEQWPNGDIAVRVRAGDTRLEQDVRWCADSLVLPALNGYKGFALWLNDGRRLTIDRSSTPTRLDTPERSSGQVWFSSPTQFVMAEGAKARIGRKATLDLRNGSVLHLMPNTVLELDPKAKLDVDASSSVRIHPGAHLKATPKQLKKLEQKGRVVRLGGAVH